MRPGRSVGALVCDECGTRLERVGRRGLRVVSSPGDERHWVVKFLPKLREARTRMRPDPTEAVPVNVDKPSTS